MLTHTTINVAFFLMDVSYILHLPSIIHLKHENWEQPKLFTVIFLTPLSNIFGV